MRASDVRDLTDGELREHIKTARRELFGLRFQRPRPSRENRQPETSQREIAQALTIQRERELQEFDMGRDKNNEPRRKTKGRRTAGGR